MRERRSKAPSVTKKAGVGPGSRTPETTPSDQDFVTSFRPLTQVEKVKVEGGTLRRGDEVQLAGIVCADCRGDIIATVGGYPIRSKPLRGWCPSDRHPTFDLTGRLS